VGAHPPGDADGEGPHTLADACAGYEELITSWVWRFAMDGGSWTPHRARPGSPVLPAYPGGAFRSRWTPALRRAQDVCAPIRKGPAIVGEMLAPMCGGEPEKLVFTAPRGGPLRESHFRLRAWMPALQELAGTVPAKLTLHHLRLSSHREQSVRNAGADSARALVSNDHAEHLHTSLTML
jgi:hypothetical protein